ncbi:hypothetical protein GUJ93_ZPchr0010g8810 [Zizania palustris]|uniref:U1-type domain-containing protein n=1 Tax=Zizania palustris TaxID=103762 RepID=A0A8J5WF43_ZIZPA|nr:hypothetical protein GUJ93_ZPchr0010g8810 [Zizania palustris]
MKTHEAQGKNRWKVVKDVDDEYSDREWEDVEEVASGSSPDLLMRVHDNCLPSPQACFVGSTVQRKPANWYPSQKKLKVQQHPLHALQSPRPNLVPSFWCKICKVDCVTEFNFSSHIGGKKHKAKKLEILGNRNTGRPGAGNECAGNKNTETDCNADSGSRNNEPNVSSSNIAGPSSNTSSVSRTNRTIENTNKEISSDGDGISISKPDENC